MHPTGQVLFAFITPATIMGCNASGTSAPMLARSLLTCHRMDVGLLTNALVSNVGVVSGLSESAAPISAGNSGSEASEQVRTTNEAQVLTPDNTPIDVAGQPVPDRVPEEPAKDFEQTLEEEMQAEGSGVAEDHAETQTPAEAAAMPNQFSAGEFQLLPTEASADPSAAADETVQEAAADETAQEATNMPQQESVVDSSQSLAQLLKTTGLPGPADTNAGESGQAGTISTPTTPESPDAVIELIAQVESKVVQPAKDNAAFVLNAQPAEGEQIEPKMTPNGTLVSQEGTATEEKSPELVSESFTGGDTMARSGEKSGDVVEQASVNTEPVSQEKSEVVREAFSNARPQPDEHSPKMTPNTFEEVKETSSNAQPQPDEHGPNMSASTLQESSGDASANRQADTLLESPVGDGIEAGPGEKTLSGDSFTQKLNAAQIEPATAQAKGRNTTTLDGRDFLESEQVISVDSPRISTAEQPFPAAQAPKSAANPSGGDIASTVGEQIRESITSSIVGPDKEIIIRLNPPELGSVLVKFQEQKDQITGMLEVSRFQTRAEIQQALPEITRDLQELGVQVKRLEVVMTGEQEHQALNGQSGMPQQDSWGGQQDATSPDAHAPYASINELPADNSAYTGFTGRPRTYVTDRSIDMFA